MNDEEFVRVARVLSSDHGLRILKAFSDDKWRIASEVSSHLDVHTSTATKYLVQLHKRGLLERRIRKTGRRSTYEYHLKTPTVLLELDISDTNEIQVLESWHAVITIFHRLVNLGGGSRFPGFEDEVDKLVVRLKTDTGMGCLCLFDPRCDLNVAKRLVRKKMDEGQLNDSLLLVKEASRVVFTALKALCLEKMGSLATEELFTAVLSDTEGSEGRVVRQLDLDNTFERGFEDE